MYLPVQLNIKNKKVLIVGGGKVALKRAKKCLDYGAKVTVVALVYVDDFKELQKLEALQCHCTAYHKKYLMSMDLVIAATDQPALNQAIQKECQKRRIWCNVVSQSKDSDVIIPASFKRGALSISVATEGKSPALAKKIINDFKESYDDTWIEKLELLGTIRDLLIQHPEKERWVSLSDIINWNKEELRALLEGLKKENNNEN